MPKEKKSFDEFYKQLKLKKRDPTQVQIIEKAKKQITANDFRDKELMKRR